MNHLLDTKIVECVVSSHEEHSVSTPTSKECRKQLRVLWNSSTDSESDADGGPLRCLKVKRRKRSSLWVSDSSDEDVGHKPCPTPKTRQSLSPIYLTYGQKRELLGASCVLFYGEDGKEPRADDIEKHFTEINPRTEDNANEYRNKACVDNEDDETGNMIRLNNSESSSGGKQVHVDWSEVDAILSTYVEESEDDGSNSSYVDDSENQKEVSHDDESGIDSFHVETVRVDARYEEVRDGENPSDELEDKEGYSAQCNELQDGEHSRHIDVEFQDDFIDIQEPESDTETFYIESD